MKVFLLYVLFVCILDLLIWVFGCIFDVSSLLWIDNLENKEVEEESFVVVVVMVLFLIECCRGSCCVIRDLVLCWNCVFNDDEKLGL